MPDAALYGPCTYRSTCDSEVKIADAHTCTLCKLPVGIDRLYHFWFKGNTLKPKDLRRAHADCYQKWLDSVV